MGSSLTNTLVANLSPSDRPYEVRDSRLNGLLLRVQPSGVRTYYVEYARGKRIAIGRADALTSNQAREQAKQVLADAYRGGDPVQARRKARTHTLTSFVEEVYGPWARQHIRTADATIRRLRVSFPELQDRKLEEITPWLIEKWRTSRLKAGTKPATVNRDLDDFRSALNKAILWDLLESNPVAGIRRSRVDPIPSIRFLSQPEELRLRGALDAREERIRQKRRSANAWRRERKYPLLPDLDRVAYADHLKPMVILSLNTGLRRGELFGLAWGDLDFDREILTVHGSGAKGGRTRHLPLNAEALAVLTGWRAPNQATEGLVFPGRNGDRLDNVRKAWVGVLRDADIGRFRWHDLRHTFASRLAMREVNLNTVRELLGHTDYAMTLRYAHLAPEHKAAAVARLLETTEVVEAPVPAASSKSA